MVLTDKCCCSQDAGNGYLLQCSYNKNAPHKLLLNQEITVAKEFGPALTLECTAPYALEWQKP